MFNTVIRGDTHDDHEQFGEGLDISTLIFDITSKGGFERVQKVILSACIVIFIILIILLCLLFHQLAYFLCGELRMIHDDGDHLFWFGWIGKVRNCVHSEFCKVTQ